MTEQWAIAILRVGTWVFLVVGADTAIGWLVVGSVVAGVADIVVGLVVAQLAAVVVGLVVARLVDAIADIAVERVVVGYFEVWN